MTKKKTAKKKAVKKEEDDPSVEMNALAMRIWDGQSISLPTNERIRRIVTRLKDKGYDVSGLSLPVDVSRFIG